MSKIKYITVILLTIAFCFGAVFAQKTVKSSSSKTLIKKSFNDDDLENLKEKAEKQREEIAFRSTEIIENFEGGKNTPTKYRKTISEELPPDRSRLLIEEKTANRIEQREYIDIGRESFIRENGGEWKIFKPTGQGGGSGMGYGSGAKPKVEILEEKSLVEGEILNGKITNRYETILRYTYTYPNKVEKMTITKSYWFNPKGQLVKMLDETNDITQKSIQRTTVRYEYGVKLNIEKPLVK